jgi:hypothetical protein
MKTVRQVPLCRTANERKIGTYNEKIILKKNSSSGFCTEGVLFFGLKISLQIKSIPQAGF